MNCEFLEPVYWSKEAQAFLPVLADGSLDLKDSTWNFTKMICDDGELYELIENESTGASFSIDKTFSYGDFFLVFFLMVFSVFKITEIIFNKFVEK